MCGIVGREGKQCVYDIGVEFHKVYGKRVDEVHEGGCCAGESVTVGNLDLEGREIVRREVGG